MWTPNLMGRTCQATCLSGNTLSGHTPHVAMLQTRTVTMLNTAPLGNSGQSELRWFLTYTPPTNMMRIMQTCATSGQIVAVARKRLSVIVTQGPRRSRFIFQQSFGRLTPALAALVFSLQRSVQQQSVAFSNQHSRLHHKILSTLPIRVTTHAKR